MTSVKNRFRAAVLGLIAAQRADALKLNTFQNQHKNDGHDSDTHTEYAVVEEGDGIYRTISSTSSAADAAGEPTLDDVDMDSFSALMSRMALKTRSPLSPTPSRLTRLRGAGGNGSGENMARLDRQDSSNIGFREFLNKNVQERHGEGYIVSAAEKAPFSDPVKREREGVEQGAGLDNKSQKRGDVSKENPDSKKEKTYLKPWEITEAEKQILKSSSPLYVIEYDMHDDKELLSQGAPNAGDTTVHKANVMVAYNKKLHEIKEMEETVQNREKRVAQHCPPSSNLPIRVKWQFLMNLEDARESLDNMKKEFVDLNQKRLEIVEQWVLRKRADNKRRGQHVLRTIR